MPDVIRFGVRAVNGAHSAGWRLWCTPPTNDVYLAAYQLGREFKVSLHQSGRWRVAFTEEHVRGGSPLVAEGAPRTWGKPWDRPSDFRPGWTHAFGIVVPWFEVASQTAVDADVVWVPPAAVGKSTVFTVLFASAGQPIPTRFFAGRIQAEPVGSITIPDGGSVWLTWHEEAFDSLRWEQWRDLRTMLAEVRDTRSEIAWEDMRARAIFLSVGDNGCRYFLEASMPGEDVAHEQWTPETVASRNDVLARLRRVQLALTHMDVRTPVEVPMPFVLVFGMFSRVRSLCHATPALMDQGLLVEAAALLTAQYEETERLVAVSRMLDEVRLGTLAAGLVESCDLELAISAEATVAGIEGMREHRQAVEERRQGVNEYRSRHGLTFIDTGLETLRPDSKGPLFESYLVAKRASAPPLARLSRVCRLDDGAAAFMSNDYDEALFKSLARLAERVPLAAAEAFAAILGTSVPPAIRVAQDEAEAGEVEL